MRVNGLRLGVRRETVRVKRHSFTRTKSQMLVIPPRLTSKSRHARVSDSPVRVKSVLLRRMPLTGSVRSD
jgi:hypothetical protein